MNTLLIDKTDITEALVDDDCTILRPDDDRWLDFITAHPDTTIFHHPAWMHVISRTYGYHAFVIAVCNAEGEILAGLPMMDVSTTLRRHHWVSLPFTDYCNPLSRDAGSLERLTTCLTSFYYKGTAPRIELRWAFPCQQEMQTCSNYVLDTIALSTDADQVAWRFDRVHRQNTRAAVEKNVRIERGDQCEHLRLFYQLQLETRRRHGLPTQPQRFFDLLADRLFQQGLGFVLLAYKGDECLAGLVLLRWKQSLIAKYAASKKCTLSLRPNNLLFWDAIKWGCNNGYKVFDIGRSHIENEGLRRYKRGWGAREFPLSYSVLPTAPARPRVSRVVEKIAQTIIRRSPVWVCRLSGELFYQHLA
jgi:CelD/BcsL family acetyltransferase involved in cellulose biosynthesis